MSRIQTLIDIAFHQWERAEMKTMGQRPPLACSSDVACALPLSPQKRARIRTAFSARRHRR